MEVAEIFETFDINDLNIVTVNGIEMKEWPEVYLFHHLPLCEEGMSVTTYPSVGNKRKRAIGFFKVKDLETLHLNIARKKGTISKHVKKLARALKNHTYVPYSVEPPVITKEGGVAAGKNRFGAHEEDLAKQSLFIDENGDVWMWAAMCDFPENEDGTVDLNSETLYVYAFNENTRSMAKEEAVDDDVVFIVSNAYEAGIIKKPTEHYVNLFLNKLNYPTVHGALMDEVLSEIDEDYCPVEVPSDDTMKKKIKEHFNKVVNTKGIHQIRSFRATSSEAAMERYFRFLLHIAPLISLGKNVTVYGKISNAKAKAVVAGRTNVENRLKPMIDIMRKLVNAYDNGTIGKILWKWVSQNKDETPKGFWL